jgi:hypothetical protein
VATRLFVDHIDTSTCVGREIGRRDGDRLFRAAARHSRFVRWMRRAIPAGIALVAAVIVIATFFNPFRLIGVFPIDTARCRCREPRSPWRPRGSPASQ